MILKNNDNATSAQYVIVVFTSLLFSSILISWFLLQMYGMSVAGIDLPITQITYSGNQDFTTNQINTSIINIDYISKWEYNAAIGRVLTQKGREMYTYLLINNIRKDKDGLIKNHYLINNSVKGDYVIILNYQISLLPYTENIKELEIKSDGIYFPSYFIGAIVSDKKVVSYPDMNKITDVDITTTYNELTGRCDIIFNGNTYTITDITPASNSDGYYGGVGSNTLGFTLKSYDTSNVIVYNPDTDLLSQFGAFLVIAFKLVLWNVDPAYLPIELNLLLIKSQCVALVIGLLNMRSGT